MRYDWRPILALLVIVVWLLIWLPLVLVLLVYYAIDDSRALRMKRRAEIETRRRYGT